MNKTTTSILSIKPIHVCKKLNEIEKKWYNFSQNFSFFMEWKIIGFFSRLKKKIPMEKDIEIWFSGYWIWMKKKPQIFQLCRFNILIQIPSFKLICLFGMKIPTDSVTKEVQTDQYYGVFLFSYCTGLLLLVL